MKESMQKSPVSPQHQSSGPSSASVSAPEAVPGLLESPRIVMQRKAMGGASGGAAPPSGAGSSGSKGLPASLTHGIAALSGMDLSDVRVHRDSAKPAQIGARAFAQNNEIHLGRGQDKYLPHEAWHIVQQRQGRVKTTLQEKGADINDEPGLEQEATAMGERALNVPASAVVNVREPARAIMGARGVVQCGGDGMKDEPENVRKKMPLIGGRGYSQMSRNENTRSMAQLHPAIKMGQNVVANGVANGVAPKVFTRKNYKPNLLPGLNAPVGNDAIQPGVQQSSTQAGSLNIRRKKFDALLQGSTAMMSGMPNGSQSSFYNPVNVEKQKKLISFRPRQSQKNDQGSTTSTQFGEQTSKQQNEAPAYEAPAYEAPAYEAPAYEAPADQEPIMKRGSQKLLRRNSLAPSRNTKPTQDNKVLESDSSADVLAEIEQLLEMTQAENQVDADSDAEQKSAMTPEELEALLDAIPSVENQLEKILADVYGKQDSLHELTTKFRTEESQFMNRMETLSYTFKYLKYPNTMYKPDTFRDKFLLPVVREELIPSLAPDVFTHAQNRWKKEMENHEGRLGTDIASESIKAFERQSDPKVFAASEQLGRNSSGKSIKKTSRERANWNALNVSQLQKLGPKAKLKKSRQTKDYAMSRFAQMGSEKFLIENMEQLMPMVHKEGMRSNGTRQSEFHAALTDAERHCNFKLEDFTEAYKRIAQPWEQKSRSMLEQGVPALEIVQQGYDIFVEHRSAVDKKAADFEKAMDKYLRRRLTAKPFRDPFLDKFRKAYGLKRSLPIDWWMRGSEEHQNMVMGEATNAVQDPLIRQRVINQCAERVVSENLSSASETLGGALDLAFPEVGDYGGIDLRVTIPAGPVDVTFDFDGELEREEDGTAIAASISVGVSGGISNLLTLNGAVGAHTEAFGENPTRTLELISYHLYKTSLLAKFDTFRNYVWGVKGRKDGHEVWAKAIEADMRKGDWVERGGHASIGMEFGNSALAGAGIDLTGSIGTRFSKERAHDGTDEAKIVEATVYGGAISFEGAFNGVTGEGEVSHELVTTNGPEKESERATSMSLNVGKELKEAESYACFINPALKLVEIAAKKLVPKDQKQSTHEAEAEDNDMISETRNQVLQIGSNAASIVLKEEFAGEGLGSKGKKTKAKSGSNSESTGADGGEGETHASDEATKEYLQASGTAIKFGIEAEWVHGGGERELIIYLASEQAVGVTVPVYFRARRTSGKVFPLLTKRWRGSPKNSATRK